MSHDTKAVGDVAEAMVLARYIELGHTVSVPFGDNARYDLVVDRGGELFRVQVKNGTETDTAEVEGSRPSRATKWIDVANVGL